MEPARGDRRPCTCSGCTGTMQFGRESDNEAVQTQTAPSSFTPHDAKGWFCSMDPDHFTHAA
jgi:hypothetical protein